MCHPKEDHIKQLPKEVAPVNVKGTWKKVYAVVTWKGIRLSISMRNLRIIQELKTVTLAPSSNGYMLEVIASAMYVHQELGHKLPQQELSV